MTQEELENIIKGLETSVSKETSTFGIFQYGGGADESFIKADKAGLILFSIELLKAAQKSNEPLSDIDKSIIPIEFEEEWINEKSDTVIQYIEPVKERQSRTPQATHKDTIADKLLPIGCIAVLALLIFALFVGLWTLAKWIF